MKQKQLSFYVTISDITIRLKHVSLRTISHVADQLADLENVDDLQIMVTSVTQHSDYMYEDSDLFIEFVKEILAKNESRKEDGLMIDAVIKAIEDSFKNLDIKRNSNTTITARLKKDGSKKFRVFAGLLNDIVLYIETPSRPTVVRFNTVERLIRMLDAMKYYGLLD